MIDLDNLDELKNLDSLGQLELINSWAFSIAEQRNQLKELSLPSKYSWKGNSVFFTKPSQILICGMGGSAIAGDYIANLLNDELDVPIFVNKNYSLPKFVNSKTLVICISYSGNTEETLSCFYEALKKGLMIVVISSNGVLSELSSSIGIPLIKIRKGQPPRTAFPLIYISLLTLFEKIFSLSDIDEQIVESIDLLKNLSEKLSPMVSSSLNQAKQIALLLYNSSPIFLSHSYCSSVSYRAKCQLNENSKMHACFDVIPESNHNSIVIWDNPAVMNHMAGVFLRLPEEKLEIKTRIDVTKELILRKTEKVVDINALGSSKIAHQLTLTYFVDYISIYLAFLNGVDPSTIEGINLLKSVLAKKHNLVNHFKDLLNS